MAGIYIHIPFCHKACRYCDFYFTTNLSNKKNLVEAVVEELVVRKNEIETCLRTIYIGGGTPSILNSQELDLIFQTLSKHFNCSNVEEITIEANPEDVTGENVQKWKSLGINRISLGVQTFNDRILSIYNRNHDKKTALNAVNLLNKAGFENINIDLIYGFTNDINIWKKDLDLVFQLPIHHLSCYQLTIEDKTYFGKLKKKGLLKISDDAGYHQLKLLEEKICKEGWEWYEVSNFCKKEKYSIHNKSYWLGDAYLGVGPSAHSFDGKYQRRQNYRSIIKYIEKIKRKEDPIAEKEDLTQTQRDIEKILTGLRTKWGVKLNELHNQKKIIATLEKASFKEYFFANLLQYKNNKLTLSAKGFYIADKIIVDIIQDLHE